MAHDEDPWVGTAAIADRLKCPQRTVQRSLSTSARADAAYGEGMWTDRAGGPLIVKKVYGVRESVVRKLESGTP